MAATATLNLTIVGDPAIGKDCFMKTWATNVFPTVYTPVVLEFYDTHVLVDDKPVSVRLLSIGKH